MDFVGALVSLDCGESGVFQGVVDAVEPATQAITLSDVFENGVPQASREPMEFVASQIVDISIVKTADERNKMQSASQLVMVPRSTYHKVNTQQQHPAVRVYNHSPIKNKARQQQLQQQQHQQQQLPVQQKTDTTNDKPRKKKSSTVVAIQSTSTTTTTNVVVAHRPVVLPKHNSAGRDPDRDANGQIAVVSQLLAQHAPQQQGSASAAPRASKLSMALQFSSQPPPPNQQVVRRPTPTKAVNQSVPLTKSKSFADKSDNANGHANTMTELLFAKPFERSNRGSTSTGDPTRSSGRQQQASGKNNWMCEPIDHAAMVADFDFESNLALFQKLPHSSLADVVDSRGQVTPGCRSPSHDSTGSGRKPAAVKNYRHDENVLNDPDRIHSWVTTTPGRAAVQPDVSQTVVPDVSQPVVVPNVSPPQRDQLKQLYSAQSLQPVSTIAPDLKRQLWTHVLHETAEGGRTALAACVAQQLMGIIGEHVAAQQHRGPQQLLLLAGRSAFSSELAGLLCAHLHNRAIQVYLYRTGTDNKSAKTPPVQNLRALKNVKLVEPGKCTPPDNLQLTVIVPDLESTQPDRFTQVWTQKFTGAIIALDTYLAVRNPDAYTVLWCWLPQTHAALYNCDQQYVMDCGASYALLKPLLPVNTYSSMKQLFAQTLCHSLAAK